MALTRKGRVLYDPLLAQVRDMGNAGSATPDYGARLAQVFAQFPDTHEALRDQGLAFYRYTLTASGQAQAGAATGADLQGLLERGGVQAEPITYEDFFACERDRHLPVQPGRPGTEAIPGQRRAASV